MRLRINIATIVGAAFGALTIYSVVGRPGHFDSKRALHNFQLPGDSSKKKKSDSVKLKYPMQDQQQDFITDPNT